MAERRMVEFGAGLSADRSADGTTACQSAADQLSDQLAAHQSAAATTSAAPGAAKRKRLARGGRAGSRGIGLALVVAGLIAGGGAVTGFLGWGGGEGRSAAWAQTPAGGAASTARPADGQPDGAGKVPAGDFFEAEAVTGSDSQAVERGDASGGKVVTNGRAWQPLVILDIPQDAQSYIVHVRHKGGPLLLKGVVDGQQKQFGAIWAKPPAYTWTKVGTYPLATIGTQLFIVRADGESSPEIDAVVLDPVGRAVGGASAAAPSRPVGELFEGELSVASDSQILNDDQALGGKYVENGRAWQPLVQVSLPEAGDRFTVHVRHKGGPLLLKTVDDQGKQIDIGSVWSKPIEWTWSSGGTYSRAQVGKGIWIIRGDGAGAVAVDAVVLGAPGGEGGPVLPEDATVASTNTTLPPDRPREGAAAQQATVSIDWSQTVGTVPAEMWGVNDYEIHQPGPAGDPGFNDFMERLDPPVIRIHRGSFPKEWLDADQRKWDVEKIKSVWANAARAYGDSAVMINISSWPKWMCEPDSGMIAREHEAAYAQLCAELVRIMRDEVKREVRYWEITNEKEGMYDKAGRLEDLWRVYNLAVAAVKKESPEAMVGGPALTWANQKWIDSFIKHGLAGSDFVTYHNYGTGDIYDDNPKLFSKLNAFEGHARQMRRSVDKAAAAAGRGHIPVHLSEFNVKWTWDPYERRHENAVGAVFHAGVIRRASLAGLDGAQVWHVKGNAYGLIDSSNRVRHTAHLYLWGPRLLVGKIAKHETSTPDLLEVLPVVSADGQRALLLANKADHPVDIGMTAADLLGSNDPMTVRQVTYQGPTESEATQSGLILPGYSVTVISAGR